MFLVLEGIIKTPIITKRTKFKVAGCKAVIEQPRRRYINKVKSGFPNFPYSFVGYLGRIKLIGNYRSKRQAKRKLKKLTQITHIGRLTSENFGEIEWISGSIITNYIQKPTKKYPKIRISKGLPRKLPISIQNLLKYALLHDFVHTERHKSKIYYEVELSDKEFVSLLRLHHNTESNNKLISTFQKYDHLSAIITRKIYSPRTNRYNWKSTENIDFQELTNKIKECENNIWKLYQFVRESKELNSLNESLSHGHTSLRKHLLITVNLIVQDFKRGKIEVF